MVGNWDIIIADLEYILWVRGCGIFPHRQLHTVQPWSGMGVELQLREGPPQSAPQSIPINRAVVPP